MALQGMEIRDLYRRRARRYDVTANLYYLLGFREWAFRKRAVAALALLPGDTVVELGCGTGLNFSLLEAAIGPSGRIIGVDLTDAMLERAAARASERGWKNVELVQCDAAAYEFPCGVDGILSTFALTLVPEFDDVIRRGAAALCPGGRWVVADFRMPGGPTRYLAPLLLPAVRPFGVSLDLAERHPWESLRRYLGNLSMREEWFGFVYVAGATAQATGSERAPGASNGVPRSTTSPQKEVQSPGTHAKGHTMKVTDPVCGMSFDPEKAVATVEHAGQTYYFCTEACRKQFEAEPGKYIKAS
jgi:ubiquinone/menaquinone biosynthesis C-methylase UbiE/YHS domain-containing protein